MKSFRARLLIKEELTIINEVQRVTDNRPAPDDKCIQASRNLFLSVGVDEDVITTPSCQRLVTNYPINGTDAWDVLFTADAVLQQTTTPE